MQGAGGSHGGSDAAAFRPALLLAGGDRRPDPYAPSLSCFAAKVVSALEAGIHLLLVDLFPPGSHDPWGMHGVILEQLQQLDEPYDLPSDEPLTLASYASGLQVDVYLEHLAVGAVLPDMPLFLRSDRYVSVPLESTYAAAYRGMPVFWKAALENEESP